MNTKKITILTQYYYPEIGAPQTRLYETANGLKELGWEVNIITALPNYPTGKIHEKYRNKLYATELINGIKVHRYFLFPSISKNITPRLLSMLSFSILAIFSIFKLRKFKPDFILTESPPLTLGITGLILAKLTSSKHILNVSDLWPLSAYELGAIKKTNVFYYISKKVEKYIYKNSDACLGQSDEIMNYFTEHKIKNISLFRNGVNSQSYAHSYPKNKTISKKIVYTGLLGVAQGICEICKNIDFKRLNIEFHIYGDGPEKEEILNLISTNSSRNIFYNGVVSNQNIPMLMKEYDFALIPLIKKIRGAVPSKIYEAMASGTPIIFSGEGEGAEIVLKYNLGKVCKPSDFISIEKALEEIAAYNETDIYNLQQNCRQTAANVFDRKIQIKSLDLYLQSR